MSKAEASNRWRRKAAIVYVKSGATGETPGMIAQLHLARWPVKGAQGKRALMAWRYWRGMAAWRAEMHSRG